MPPIVLSSTPADPGYVRLVVSSEPGRRLQLVVAVDALQRPDWPDTLALLVQGTDRKGNR